MWSRPANAVQVQVHDSQPSGAVDNLPTVEGMVPQVGQLALVHVPVVLPDVLVGHQQEPAVPQAGSQMVESRLGAHHIDDCLDQGAGA